MILLTKEEWDAVLHRIKIAEERPAEIAFVIGVFAGFSFALLFFGLVH